jgi:integrase
MGVEPTGAGCPPGDRRRPHGSEVGSKQADPKAIRFHDLRHTAATLLLTQGVHPKVVGEMLGRATITLTLDTYSHLAPVLHQQAAAEMDAALGA